MAEIRGLETDSLALSLGVEDVFMKFILKSIGGLLLVVASLMLLATTYTACDIDNRTIPVTSEDWLLLALGLAVIFVAGGSGLMMFRLGDQLGRSRAR